MFSHYIPALFWGLFIFILCAIPGKNLPHYSWADLLSVDKLVHFTLFFILIILLKRAWLFVYKGVRSNNLLAIAIGVIYGGSLELMQSYFYTDRSGSWFDFLANSLGAICGVLFFGKLIDNNGRWKFSNANK
ncbi:MAG TPA: VanZ family protein [Bacteroidia bacterium]|nr:VanZ family protein [Bacteroidia bacterium]HNG84532.1 VanZ family protein [Bacteroidia bacterium]HNO81998.1 VanZ family protein [Bacteroidia bacterium]